MLDFHFLKKLFDLLQWKPSKNDESCFISSWKLFLFSRCLNFFLDFFSCTEHGLIKKDRVNFKIQDVTGEQNISIHMLLNTSQSKGNQIMKFGKLKEYNTRNAFLQKSFRKWGSETSPRPLSFLKKELYLKLNPVSCHVVSIYFDSLELDI